MKYIVRGVNDERDTCEHCGRAGLKRVVWLESTDPEGNGSGQVSAIGTSCAARLLRTTAARIQRAAEQADRERIDTMFRTVHQIGPDRSAVDWKVLVNGDWITQANGLLPAVQAWADSRWPARAEVARPIL